MNNFNPNLLRSKVGALLAEVPNGRLQVGILRLSLLFSGAGVSKCCLFAVSSPILLRRLFHSQQLIAYTLVVVPVILNFFGLKVCSSVKAGVVVLVGLYFHWKVFPVIAGTCSAVL